MIIWIISTKYPESKDTQNITILSKDKRGVGKLLKKNIKFINMILKYVNYSIHNDCDLPGFLTYNGLNISNDKNKQLIIVKEIIEMISDENIWDCITNMTYYVNIIVCFNKYSVNDMDKISNIDLFNIKEYNLKGLKLWSTKFSKIICKNKLYLINIILNNKDCLNKICSTLLLSSEIKYSSKSKLLKHIIKIREEYANTNSHVMLYKLIYNMRELIMNGSDISKILDFVDFHIIDLSDIIFENPIRIIDKMKRIKYIIEI